MSKFVISVYVDNTFGVLTRVTSMFTRRGFNIDSLTVGETEDLKYSRITITMSGDELARAQLISQLKKLHNVKKVEFLGGETTIERELMLIKIKNDAKTRQDVLASVNIFRAKIIDYSPTALCIEITGDSSKIDAFIDVIKPIGIIEMCRTGVVALERGGNSLLNK